MMKNGILEQIIAQSSQRILTFTLKLRNIVGYWPQRSSTKLGLSSSWPIKHSLKICLFLASDASSSVRLKKYSAIDKNIVFPNLRARKTASEKLFLKKSLRNLVLSTKRLSSAMKVYQSLDFAETSFPVTFVGAIIICERLLSSVVWGR